MISSNTVGKSPPNSSYFQSMVVLDNIHAASSASNPADITDVSLVTTRIVFSGSCRELRLNIYSVMVWQGAMLLFEKRSDCVSSYLTHKISSYVSTLCCYFLKIPNASLLTRRAFSKCPECQSGTNQTSKQSRCCTSIVYKHIYT